MSDTFTTTNSWNQLTVSREKGSPPGVKYAPLGGKQLSFEDYLKEKGLDPSQLQSWEKLQLHREYSNLPPATEQAGNDGLMLLTLSGGIKVKVDPTQSISDQRLNIGRQLAPNAITEFEQFQIADSVLPRIKERYGYLK